MRKLTKALIAVVMMLVVIPACFLINPMVQVWASNITLSKYFGTLIIHNDSSTPNSSVIVTANISRINLVAGQYIDNLSANDTAVQNTSGADVAWAPLFSDNTSQVFWVPEIGADAFLTYLFYMRDSTGGKIRYFPDSAGMTIADNISMEPFANFAINTSVYIDTDAGAGTTVLKASTFEISTSDTIDGDINVDLLGGDQDCLDFVAANNDWCSVPDDDAFSFTDGAGNDEPFTIIAWVNFDDVISRTLVSKAKVAGNHQEWVFNTDGAGKLFIGCFHSTAAASITVESLGIAADVGTWHHYVATYDGTEINTGLELYRDGVNVTNARGGAGVYTGMTNRDEVVNIGSQVTGAAAFMEGQMAEVKIYDVELTQPQIAADFAGTHRTADLVAHWPIDEGVGLPQDTSGNGHHTTTNLADWVATFTQRYGTFLTASGITSGEHVIEVYTSAGNMLIDIDSVNEDTQALGGVSVTNTAADWVIGSDATPYIEYYRHTVNGSLKCDIWWEYDNIFTDLSGNSNDATPTFRTVTTDPNVTVNMTAFQPVSEATAPGYVLGPGNPFITSTSNITGNFTVVPPTGDFPLAGVITAISNATATPPQLPLLIIACFIILAASLTTSYTMRKFGSGTLFAKSLVICALLGIFVALGDFGIDFWMIFVFSILAIAIMFMSRQGTWR